MKTKKRFLLITAGFIFFGTLSCKNAPVQDNFSEVQVKKMLNDFYTSFITVLSSSELFSSQRLDSIQRAYCTPNYFEEVMAHARDLERNPLIKAQAISLEYLKTLTIQKDKQRDDLYYVSYTNTDTQTQTTIKLVIVKEKDYYKIDCVYLDDLKLDCPCKKEKK